MKLKTGLGIILALLLVYTSTFPASARYYTYRAEDPAKQDTTFNGVENQVFLWWWFDSAFPAVWWADPALDADATASINSWTAYIPFVYAPNSSEESATLKFKYMACPGLPYASACLKTGPNYYFDPDLKANYILYPTIYVIPIPYIWRPPAEPEQKLWSTWGRKRVMTRELGSFYGLQQRWLGDNEQCNDDELTIMDGIKLQNNTIEHCDEMQGPQIPDRGRVEAYWGKPDETNRRMDITVSGIGVGPIGYFTWKDMAWADVRHRIGFYYLNGSQWELKHLESITTDIGTHFLTEDRQIQWNGDRRNYNGNPGEYMLCVSAHFAAYAPSGYTIGGPVRCSESVTLQ